MTKVNFIDQVGTDPALEAIIRTVLKAGDKELKLRGTRILNVILVNDDTIHQLNKQYRNIDRPTDVLSFDNSEGKEIGDVFISIDRVVAQATEYGHSFDRELAFLACHGFLHCLGYDHGTKEEETTMFGLQDRILKRASFER